MVGAGPSNHVPEHFHGVPGSCCSVCDLGDLQGRLADGGGPRDRSVFYQLVWLTAIFVGWSITVALMAVLVGFLLVPIMALVTRGPFVQATYEAYVAYKGARRRYL